MDKFIESEGTKSRTEALLDAREKPRNTAEHQMVLAEELYIRDHPSESMATKEHDFRNKVMEYWIERTYSEKFRKLIQHPVFKNHGRFKGDPLAVTLSDVEYFLNNNSELPER